MEWASLHPATEATCATLTADGRDTGIAIAGDGAPLVAEFAVIELATSLGMSHEAGRNLLGQALELVHRLPRTWASVESGRLPVWKARRIAEHTLTLPFDAAAWVDAQVGPYAHRTSLAQVERLVAQAIERFDPPVPRPNATGPPTGAASTSTTSRSPSPAPPWSGASSTSPTPSTSTRPSPAVPSSSPSSAPTWTWTPAARSPPDCWRGDSRRSTSSSPTGSRRRHPSSRHRGTSSSTSTPPTTTWPAAAPRRWRTAART